MAVRCQLLFLWRVVRVFADARGGQGYDFQLNGSYGRIGGFEENKGFEV
jgi:hypothetical protein